MIAYRYMDASLYREEALFGEGLALLPSALRPYAAAPKDKEARALRLGGLVLLTVLWACESGHAPLPPIAFSEKGKPFFTEGELHFNISHSGRIALCALSDRPIGADIEPIKKEFTKREEDIARRFFTEEERRLLAAAPDKGKAFTEIWVRKEALVKRSGEGASALFATDTTAARFAKEETVTDNEGTFYFLSIAD